MVKNIGGFTGAENFRSKSEMKRKIIQRKATPLIKRKATPLIKRKTAVPGIQKDINATGMKRFIGGGKIGPNRTKKSK